MPFCIKDQEIGDIILIKNKAITSKANIALQVLGSLKSTVHSHAILALFPGRYIEAMNYGKDNKKLGIDFLCINELLDRLSN